MQACRTSSATWSSLSPWSERTTMLAACMPELEIFGKRCGRTARRWLADYREGAVRAGTNGGAVRGRKLLRRIRRRHSPVSWPPREPTAVVLSGESAAEPLMKPAIHRRRRRRHELGSLGLDVHLWQIRLWVVRSRTIAGWKQRTRPKAPSLIAPHHQS